MPPKVASAAPEWTLADRWVRARLNTLVGDVEHLFGTHQYGEAGRQIYDFFWSEFADWYVETAKLQLAEGGDRAFYTLRNLVNVLDTCLRLLHPFTPFVTEELWGHLKRAAQEHSAALDPAQGWEEALIVARWPEQASAEGGEEQTIKDFELIMDAVRGIRNLRVEKKVAPGKRIPATVVGGERAAMLRDQARTLASLASLDAQQVTVVENLAEKPQGQTPLVVAGVEIYLPLSDLVDAAAERARIQKELADTQSQIARLEGLLGSPFAQKAPAAVVDKERQKLATYQESANKLSAQLADLG
ncbi:MAG TPA: class I tRNA ligase family protein [Anaerolineaceae bacterium]|nr:class I tRNA ligase family protein [Anaerolineaceae bacterium]